ncbi:MAG TPA: hypothetical protein VF710_07470 [Longimicrobium sp.]
MSAIRALLCALAVLVAGAPLAAQDTPPGYEQGIYDLRVGSLNPLSVPVLLDERGAVLVPLRPLLELSGAPFRVVPDSGLAVVSRPRGAGQAVLDVRAGTLTAATHVTLAPTDALVWASDVYATVARAAQLLEAEAATDAAELTVRFTRAVPFPAQERGEAEARRQFESGQGRDGPAVDPRSVPFRPRTGGAVLEWGVSTSTPDLGVPDAGSAVVGLGVYGGMLQVGAAVSNPGGGLPVRTDPTARFRRVFPLNRWLRQLQLGDVATENLRVRAVRGVTITNAPFIRDPLFGSVQYDPSLPAGWDYEVYQDGRLLGFSHGAERGPVSIPLGYGSTPVRVRLYGPAGEQVESELVYLVPVTQLPAGRWQYAVGGGACVRDPDCRQMGYVDVRHGLSRALTLFAGADALAGDESRVRPYGGASLAGGSAWAAQVEAMAGAFIQGALQNFGSGPVSGTLSGGVTFPELDGRSLAGPGGAAPVPGTGTRWNVDASAGIRTPRAGRRIGVTGRVEGGSGTGLDHARGSVLGTLRGVILEAAVEHVASPVLGTSDVGSLRGTFPLHALSSRLPSGTLITAEAGAGAGGLQRGELGVYAQVRSLVVNAVGRWDARISSPSLVIGTSLRFGYGRAQARLGSQGGQLTGGTTVSGALAFSGGAGIAPLPYGGMGQSGLHGVVFHDLDGNGSLDPGDEPVPDARVFVGGALVKTDAAGRYAIWSVLPYEIASVRVDTIGLNDPSWVPMRDIVLLRPSPHLFTRVDLALAPTRELAGALVPGPGVATASGITVEILGADGAVSQRVLTFSDGSFYIGRIRPGQYQARVSESSLRALGARAAPATVTFTVPASGTDPLVEIPAIRLVRAQ